MLSGLTTQAAYAQVVVFAPHPDDEALIASGIVYRARQSGQTVKVVVATNGDCEEPTIGRVREQETIAAMERLGLTAQDVIFLGYPDCGLRSLYYNFTTPESQFTSAAGRTHTYAYEGLGQTDYHSYNFGAPASYNGVSLMQDLQAILNNYKPQDIYVTSAYDAHPDHYALNFLLGEVILSKLRSDATFQPTVHDAIVHDACSPCDPNNPWPMPSFRPTQPFSAPPMLPTTPLAWSDVESVEVPAALQATTPETNLKSQAISQYASQAGGGEWMQAFVKRNEIFWKWELWANLALKATATASSAIGTGTTADRINDASVVGFPVVPSVDSGGKGEWVSSQLVGAWAQLSWTTSQSVTRIVIHDRPDASENISAGTLTFSDGSSQAVSALPTNGVGLTVSFPTKNVTWIRFTVNTATGTAAGLAELEVYGPPTSKLPWQPPTPGNTAPAITAGPTASPLTISAAATSALAVTAFDANGDLLIYNWTTTGGRIEGSGSAVTFIPPVVSTPTTYRITVFVADGRGGSASSWVDVTVTPSNSSGNVAQLATATASSVANSAAGQTAEKVIDGFVSGYPVDAQREWASAGELAGAWIQLTWTTPVSISQSVLHDRINTVDQILGGTLRFSDGSSLLVGALPDGGAGLTTNFASRTVTWIRFEVTSARGDSVGLAEWEVSTGVPRVIPEIRGVAPGAVTPGAVSRVRITGANFSGNMRVFVSGRPASDVVVESLTSMTALVPALAQGAYDLAVVTPLGEMAALPNGLFYGSSRLDLLWHHQEDGRVATWLLNGTNNLSGSLLDPSQEPDTAWKVVGAGDLDGDGQPDVVWQNITTGALRVWFMNGRALRQAVPLGSSPVDTAWRIRSVGDWDGDGMADLVWQHQADGRIALWLMNGYTQRSGTLFTPSAVPDTGWQIAGSADFNRDGRRDLLWQHTDGRLAVWLMNGLTLMDGGPLIPSAVSDTNWKVRGVGDINGDGHVDLIWQHRVSGAISTWLMNGLRMVAGQSLNPGSVPDTNWQIVGPR